MQRVAHGIKWVEIALAVGALAAAMWQLVLIDRGMIGFVLVWMIPPVLAVGARLRRRASAGARGWAAAYLLLVVLGNLVAPYPRLFPAFTAEHRGSTEFADRWNRLDVGSRRLISWNMTVSGAFMFAWLGYTLFWSDLRRRQQYGYGEFSTATCLLGLLATWLLPAIGLLGIVSMALSPP